MIPAILYAAKSTEDTRGSIATQLKDGRAMAKREGWEVVGEYRDEGFSAYSGNRGPGLKRAEAEAFGAAKEHGEAVLVVQHSDRLARGAGFAPDAADNLAEVYSRLARKGVKLRTVQDDLFADPRIAPLMAALMGMRNAEDSARKSGATSAGIQREKAKGRYIGADPYGYGRKEGELVIDKREATIVRRIFAEFVAGRSMVAIARGLNADNVPTQTKTPAGWRSPTIGGILRRPTYVGLVKSGDEWIEGNHEAIIDAETFRRVQDLLAAQAETKAKGAGRPPKGRHLFKAGLLRCGQCNDAMVTRTRTTPTWYEAYCCGGHIQRGDDYCTQGCVSRRDVDEAVFAYFQKVALDREATQTALAESRNRKLAELHEAIDAAEFTVSDLVAESQRLQRALREGDLEAKRFGPIMDGIEKEQKTADAEVKRLRKEEKKVEKWSDLDDADKKLTEELTAIRELIAQVRSPGRQLSEKDKARIDAVRAALTRLFESFTIYPDKARIVPKRRPQTLLDVNFDPAQIDSDETPELELTLLLTPDRVALDLTDDGDAQGNERGRSGSL